MNASSMLKFRLREEVGFARLVNELGHFAHRLVDRRIFELRIDDKPEDDPEHRNDQAEHQEMARRYAEERQGVDLAGNDERVFASAVESGRHAKPLGGRRGEAKQGYDEERHRREQRFHGLHANLSRPPPPWRREGDGVDAAVTPRCLGARLHEETDSCKRPRFRVVGRLRTRRRFSTPRLVRDPDGRGGRVAVP
jgi:hypothetical protein